MNKIEEITGIDKKIGKEKSVQKMFSSIARYYDINNTILSLGIHHQWKKVTVETLNASKGDTILDLCSGTGDLALLIADIVTNEGKVAAVDLNREMLEVGRDKSSDVANMTCIRCNAEVISFKDDTFDGATVAFGMRNLSDLSKGFKEIHRVLKKDSKVVCLEFSRPTSAFVRMLYNVFSSVFMPVGKLVSGDNTEVYQYLPESIKNFPEQEKLKEIMFDAGFKHVEYRNLTGGIVAVHTGVK